MARTRFKGTIDRWMGEARTRDWELAWLGEFLHERPDARVLDAGCGTKSKLGRFEGTRSVGVDTDETLFSNRDVHWRARASVDRLPFQDASFDLVYSKYVA